MGRIGRSQEDHNGRDTAHDTQQSNEENKNLTIRKVNLTWQRSTKMIAEQIHRQKKCPVAEEITPNRNEDHCITLHICRNAPAYLELFTSLKAETSEFFT